MTSRPQALGAPTPQAKPWIVYVRVSDEDQTKGLSLDAQRDTCVAFLTARGITAFEIVAEPGRSAFRDDAIKRRPEIRQVLERAKLGEIAGIIVWKSDRLCRSLYDTLTVAKMLREHGAGIVTLVEGIDTMGPNGPFLMQLHAMLDEKASHDTSLRVKASFAKKIERGEWLGGPLPVGCRPVGDEGRRRLEADPVTGPIVAQIWQRVIDGATLNDIGVYLRSNGVLPYNGSRRRASEPRKPRVWRRQTVLNLLRCKALVGLLVDATTRDRALAALGGRFAPSRADTPGLELVPQPKASMRTWRLARIARCAHCGAALNGVHSRGKSGAMYPYLRCSAKAKSSELCSATDLPAEAWEQVVIDAVLEAVAENGPLVEQLGADLKQRQRGSAGLSERRAELVRELDATRARAERVTMLVADGDAAAEAVRPTLAKLHAEMKAQEHDLAVVDGEIAAAQMTAADLERLLATIAANVQALTEKPLDQQAAILATLLKSVRIGYDHPIRLTFWWDDRVFVQQSRMAPRSGHSTNTATVTLERTITMRRVGISDRGGCRWQVALAPRQT